MRLEEMHFAWIVPDVPVIIEKGVAVGYPPRPMLVPPEDRTLEDATGANFSLVEAYATPEARDAVLGSGDAWRKRVRVTYAEVDAAGLPAHRIAVGHRAGEPGFEAVLGAIAEHVAANLKLTNDESGEITIGSVKYTFDTNGRPTRSEPFLWPHPSNAEHRVTEAWVWKAMGALLGPKPEPAPQGED
jgi:hypothetical protein